MNAAPRGELFWQAAPDRPELALGDVHVWRVRLASERSLVEIAALLAPEERARAGRLVHERDRRRFVTTRAALRVLLGLCTGTQPRRVALAMSAAGKPELAGAAGESDLRFNVSHSGDLALLAFARGREVGVDVEDCARELDYEAVAGQMFTPAERRELNGVEPPLRRCRFFELWTRREAILKASGEGLARPLATLDLAHWSVRELSPAPGYAGAVATQGELRQLRGWDWDAARLAKLATFHPPSCTRAGPALAPPDAPH